MLFMPQDPLLRTASPGQAPQKPCTSMGPTAIAVCSPLGPHIPWDVPSLLRGRWRTAASSAPASSSEPASPGGTSLGGREAVRPGASSGAHPAACTEQGLQGHPRLQHSALAWPPRIPPEGRGSSICLPNSPHIALQQHLRVPMSPHQAPHGQGLLHSSRPAASRPDPLTLFHKICSGKHQPKVLETSSRCCSTAGSCDLILFLIFFFFFFFMPCAGWRNTKFQAPCLGKEAFVTKPAERTAAGGSGVLHHLCASAPAEMLRDVSPLPWSDSHDPTQLICKQS